ncbi:hypothetical protein RJ640_017853 [Escallonia rubra]|uniref:Uncharacterized protein n=1 Tax=Escallonia rubra TaxID=112253 RepID=A0AA88S1T9_9ASTE|nr:hypothetical protein RJ640_017853 [Escallonia rubra]
MNILKLHQATLFPNFQTTHPRALLTRPHFLSPHTHKPHLLLSSNSRLSLCKPRSIELRHVKASRIEAQSRSNEEEENLGADDLTPGGEVYKKTLRLVECSMFAALGGLAYILSSSLSIEDIVDDSICTKVSKINDNVLGKQHSTYDAFYSINLTSQRNTYHLVTEQNYFGCFFALPIVFSSMRWGIAAGRKTMVATATLLLVLSGPIKALTYLLLHGLLGLTMGSLWSCLFFQVGGNMGSFRLFVLMCMLAPLFLNNFPLLYLVIIKFTMSGIGCLQVRAMGATGYVLIYSFLIRENILALITINIHASLTYVITSLGLYTIPSMNTIYAIFGTLLLLNCGFFAFLLHLLYAVFFTRLGMKGSLRLPGWLEKAI